MSLEITIGDMVRAPRERLTPGMVIGGLTDYNQVPHLINNFGRKLRAAEEDLAVRYSSPSANRRILIENNAFRNSKRFWGTIRPELALIMPADISLVPRSYRRELNENGLGLLLRYRLASTGKDRIYLVECGFFREMTSRLVWVFAKERKSKDAMEKVIAQRPYDYAQQLREGLDRMFAIP